MIFFVSSSISYRPTDLSLLKEFFKIVSFSSSYKLSSQSAIQKISMSMDNIVESTPLQNSFDRQYFILFELQK